MHALAEYSAEDWDRIWRESHGRVCGFVGGESPPEPRSRRAVLAGALLTAISPLMAQTGRVRIRVTEATGAVVTTAEAALLGVDAKPIRTLRANDAGEIAWMDLPLGDCRFALIAPGFKARPLLVTLRNSDEVKIEATLEVGTVGTMVEVETVFVEPALPSAASAPAQEPKRTKRRRWWIFR